MTETRTDQTAANVRAEVARRRVKQREIAAALGLNQQQVSRRLTGQVEFSVSELQAIARLLNVPVHQLMGEASERGEVSV